MKARITIDLDVELVEFLKEVSSVTGKSRNQLITELVEKLKREEAERIKEDYDFLRASESTTQFWENPIDDEIWNEKGGEKKMYNPNLTEQEVKKLLETAKVQYSDLKGGGDHWSAKDQDGHFMQIVRGETCGYIFMKRKVREYSLQMLSEYEDTKYFTPYCIDLDTYEVLYGPGMQTGKMPKKKNKE